MCVRKQSVCVMRSHAAVQLERCVRVFAPLHVNPYEIAQLLGSRDQALDIGEAAIRVQVQAKLGELHRDGRVQLLFLHPLQNLKIMARHRLSFGGVLQILPELREDGRDPVLLQGASGFERAEAQRRRLTGANLTASIRQELGDAWTLRLGPLTHAAAWMAIEAFIGPGR